MPNDPMPYVLDPNLPIAKQWTKPLSEIATLPPLSLSAEEKERHRIFSLVLFSLMKRFFNGNKNGSKGEYPFRPNQREADGRYTGSDYLGHNIGALAVDGEGDIIDFDFNHNQIFASSAEHAEARLVRRIFSLSQIQDGWQLQTTGTPVPSGGYSTQLNDVTLYTSLESCAQCSGVMALGQVKAVVFLQRDPGTYHIGNIMRSLAASGNTTFAPLPIPGSDIGFGYFDELNQKYRDYYATVGTAKPFWKPSGTGSADTSRALTSFLCTDDALDVFTRATAELATFTLAHPTYQPNATSLTNADALKRALAFSNYATKAGRRGTAHGR